MIFIKKYIVFLFFLLPTLTIAQINFPEKEFRASWVVTLNNIDWPSENSLSVEQQKQEFEDIVRFLSKNNFNAAIVQVRPAADAFYPSPYEPWSQWINGRQGLAPDPLYDPLEFMIGTCKKYNIEFHAWVNPFRAVASIEHSSVAEDHISKKRPEWCISYADSKFFNIGIPEVRAYLKRVIEHIILQYDIDGIHFDDYFYPYPENGGKIRDYETFEVFGGNFESIETWRRDNVNQFIYSIHSLIKDTKPYLRFGVSPYPVWRESRVDLLGSNSLSGLSNYDHLYADIRLWLEKGWIDYVAPQLYHHLNHNKLPFNTLAKWWNENSFGKNVYAGLATYKLFNNYGYLWNNTSLIPSQITISKDYGFDGQLFFSANDLLKNRGSIMDSLKMIYGKKTLTPCFSPKDTSLTLLPVNPTISTSPKGVILSWKINKIDSLISDYQFVIYSNDPTAKSTFEILDILDENHTSYFDSRAKKEDQYIYYISVIDRFKNESKRVCFEIEK